jgi:hypothetical protein
MGKSQKKRFTWQHNPIRVLDRTFSKASSRPPRSTRPACYPSSRRSSRFFFPETREVSLLIWMVHLPLFLCEWVCISGDSFQIESADPVERKGHASRCQA